MKAKIFCALFFVSACCFADDAGKDFPTGIPISAEEYCAFLNQKAASDPLHCYDAKMTTGLGSACIERLGAVGSYRYQAQYQAAGAEQSPASFSIVFLSYNDAVAFAHWKSQRETQSFSPQPSTFSLAPSYVAIDPQLKSNKLFFKIVDTNENMSRASDAESPCHGQVGLIR